MFSSQNNWKVVSGNKTVYDPTRYWSFNAIDTGNVMGAYIPEIPMDENLVIEELKKIPFNRVTYINPYSQIKVTPRYTFAYGVSNQGSKTVSFTKGGRCLNFESEPMPEWLEALSQTCREIAKSHYGFDPEYNSAIIGLYTGKEDAISFHFDTEPFLKHHFCANVTIGAPRDFQFRVNEKMKADAESKGEKILETHQISLGHKSLFFFLGLEHALPKRAGAEGQIRFSISFRNMNTDDGIANSFYYCRGKEHAIDDETKRQYMEKFNRLYAADPRFTPQ